MCICNNKVNENGKRYANALKILDVEPKRVARTNNVEKTDNYEFTKKGKYRMVCFFTLIIH